MMYHHQQKKKNIILLVVVSFMVVVVVVLSTVLLDATVSKAEATAEHNDDEDVESGRRRRRRRRQRPPTPPPPLPNIVVILTDDLDLTLTGGIETVSTLKQTRLLLRDQGKTFTNWFAQTPVCCPSRASLLTGRYFHNLRRMKMKMKPEDVLEETTKSATNITATTSHDCMHVDVDGTNPDHKFWKDYYFAQYFNKNNFTNDTSNNNNINNNINNYYRVGIFGKHLNTENPSTFLPPGVDTMFINGGGNYIDPIFTYGYRSSSDASDDDDEHEATVHIETKQYFGYSTSIISNQSLTWIEKQFQLNQYNDNISESNRRAHHDHHRRRQQPIFALISVKAPHIQDEDTDFPKAIPDSKYNQLVLPVHEQKAPRVPNYNFTTTTTTTTTTTAENDVHLKHWVVRTQPPFTDVEAWNVDELYQSRLRTLQSVDDMVVDLVQLLEDVRELNNTYIVFTSDNGYRFGQFQMPQLKLHPYENDIRVPTVIRGPGIVPNSSTGVLASHVDLIPTLLGLVANKKETRYYNKRLFEAAEEEEEEDVGSGNEQRQQRRRYETKIPHTMDGTDLSGIVLDDKTDDILVVPDQDDLMEESASSSVPTESLGLLPPTRSILIEYYSLGNVRRYRHLVDTYNHTFIALRIMMPSPPPSQPLPQSGRTDDATASLLRYTDGDGKEHVLHDSKYVEFRDSRIDWNCTMSPLEVELYDLARDPYELHNLLPVSGITGTTTDADQIYHVPSDLINLLTQKMKRMFHCTGKACRKEQRTGLEPTSHEHDNAVPF